MLRGPRYHSWCRNAGFCSAEGHSTSGLRPLFGCVPVPVWTLTLGAYLNCYHGNPHPVIGSTLLGHVIVMPAGYVPAGRLGTRFLQIRLRHESRDKYVIHISKTAFQKMLFWNAALLCEHYGAAEQVTWLMTHPYRVGAPPIGMLQSKWISFQTLNC